jgi:hypothetical protein
VAAFAFSITGKIRRNVEMHLYAPRACGMQAALWPAPPQVYALHYGSAQTPLALVVPDAVYAGLFRVRWPGGCTSDMTNLARAKDAAVAICERGPPRRARRFLHWKINGGETARKPGFPHPQGGR